MNRIAKLLSILGLFTSFLLFAPALQAGSAPSSITILASSSLTNVMTDLIRLYSITEDETVSAVYNSPSELADAIIAGEPADIYISEHPTKMLDLERLAAFDVYTITTLVSNRLVLIVPKDSYLSKILLPTIPLPKLLENINKKTNLVMGDPNSVPAGMLAKVAIQKLGYWERIEPFVESTSSVRKALYLIAKGKKAGIVYYTDAFNNPEVQIVSEFPAELHDPIIYRAAVVNDGNMPLARKFLNFLKTDAAMAVFKKHGFMTD